MGFVGELTMGCRKTAHRIERLKCGRVIGVTIDAMRCEVTRQPVRSLFLPLVSLSRVFASSQIRGLRSIEPEHPPEKPCASKAGPPSSLPASGPPALLRPSNVALGNSMLSKSVLGVVASDRASLLASLKASFVRGELQGSAGDALAGLRPGTAPAEPTNERNLDTLPSRWVRAEDLSRVGDRRPEERIASAPSRTSRDWRPAPLLCKRLGVANPYHGRAPELQVRLRSAGWASRQVDAHAGLSCVCTFASCSSRAHWQGPGRALALSACIGKHRGLHDLSQAAPREAFCFLEHRGKVDLVGFFLSIRSMDFFGRILPFFTLLPFRAGRCPPPASIT